MNRDMPTISASTYTSSALPMHKLMGAASAFPVGQVWSQPDQVDYEEVHEQMRRMQKAPVRVGPARLPQPAQQEQKMTTRVVQVFVADPTSDLIPPEDRLLYKSEQKTTDATDQELYFELPIKELLDAHNAKRIKIVDKTIKDRTEYLEPVKIRDLKMVVVTVATF